MQSNYKIITSQQIQQKLWHNMIPKDYLINSTLFQFSSQQITSLLQLNTPIQIHSILTPEQTSKLLTIIQSSPNNKAYIKVNGRTPKDLPYLNRPIATPQQFIQILHTSQYILEVLHKNQPANVVIRQFVPLLFQNTNIYDIYVRAGFVLAIGQKFCDHIQLQHPDNDLIDKIINAVQIIMPAITIISPKNSQLNSFLVSAYCQGQTLKITSISQYPPYDKSTHQIFSESELQIYYNEIQQQSLHKQQRYEQNQGVIPMIKTIKKKQDIKYYDMGEYLIGHQIDDEEKMKEWKQFIQEANENMGD